MFDLGTFYNVRTPAMASDCEAIAVLVQYELAESNGLTLDIIPNGPFFQGAIGGAAMRGGGSNPGDGSGGTDANGSKSAETDAPGGAAGRCAPDDGFGGGGPGVTAGSCSGRIASPS